MKRGAILAAVAFATASFLATISLAVAQGPAGPGGFRHEGPGMEHGPARWLPPGTWWRDQSTVTAIGLSADQQKKIDDIFLNARVQLIHMHASLEENQVRLDDALNATTFDAGRAQKLIDEGADDRAALEKADAHMLLAIRGVLTADQWTKLHTLRPRGPRGDGERSDRGPGLRRGPDGARRGGGLMNPPTPPPPGGDAAPAPPASE